MEYNVGVLAATALQLATDAKIYSLWWMDWDGCCSDDLMCDWKKFGLKLICSWKSQETYTSVSSLYNYIQDCLLYCDGCWKIMNNSSYMVSSWDRQLVFSCKQIKNQYFLRNAKTHYKCGYQNLTRPSFLIINCSCLALGFWGLC